MKRKKVNKYKNDRYVIIAKIANNPNGKAKCVKYKVNKTSADVDKFISFLDRKFPTWTWANIYDKKTTLQVGSFTCKNRKIKKCT